MTKIETFEHDMRGVLQVSDVLMCCFKEGDKVLGCPLCGLFRSQPTIVAVGKHSTDSILIQFDRKMITDRISLSHGLSFKRRKRRSSRNTDIVCVAKVRSTRSTWPMHCVERTAFEFEDWDERNGFRQSRSEKVFSVLCRDQRSDVFQH